MTTSTLLTLLALFFALFTCASALPTTFSVSDASSVTPRSLLGRSYFNHNLALVALSNAVLPADDAFAGRADRFHILQLRRAARALTQEHIKENSLLSNHTMPAHTPAGHAGLSHVGASTQMQAPIALSTTTIRRPVRVGGLRHHRLKKAAARSLL